MISDQFSVFKKKKRVHIQECVTYCTHSSAGSDNTTTGRHETSKQGHVRPQLSLSPNQGGMRNGSVRAHFEPCCIVGCSTWTTHGMVRVYTQTSVTQWIIIQNEQQFIIYTRVCGQYCVFFFKKTERQNRIPCSIRNSRERTQQ